MSIPRPDRFQGDVVSLLNVKLRAFLLGTTLVLTSAASARADCAGSVLHLYFAHSSVVFLADVREVVGPHVVFDIHEAFKGSRRGRVTLSMRGASESFHFRAGERVLVMAWRQEGQLSTQCSGTRVVKADDPDVSIVRHLAAREPGGTVEGVLSRFDHRWLRYPGIRITLRPLSGWGPVRSMITGPRNGHFRFEWVPPGRYVVAMEGPSGVRDQQRLIYVGVDQVHLSVPAFIISAREHPLIADPLD